jgi:NitT/TauT family transport system substrate-binding protein
VTSVRIRLLWHPQPQFAGYLVAERLRLAAMHGVELVCVPLDFDLGTVAAVLSGDCAFAVASPSHMLESAAPEELVLLLAIQQESSLVYPARRSDGIARLTDLAGHRIAVWPGGEDLELRWMLHRAGMTLDSVTRVPADDTVAALVAGEVSCAQMTTYHELHVLERALAEAGSSLDEFVLLRAAELGAGLLKDGLIGRRDWIDAHLLETQAVIDAVLMGWTRSFDDPVTAVDICAATRPDMSRDEHRRQLQDIRMLSTNGAAVTRGLGYPASTHMVRAAAALTELEGRRPIADPRRLVDDRFWGKAPANHRRTAW